MKHEANLQFEIAYALRQANIPFELEWISPVGRHDIAVKNDTHIYGIIECKRKKIHSNTWQITRYRSLNIPIIMANFASDIPKIVCDVSAWNPKLLSAVMSNPNCIKTWKRPRSRLKKLLHEADESLNFRM
jgi:hypothetical protein